MNIDNILEIEKDKIVFTNNVELLFSENTIRKIKKQLKKTPIFKIKHGDFIITQIMSAPCFLILFS